MFENGVDMEVKVFFRQGWFTCGRTKEYLSQNNIDYIRIGNTRNEHSRLEHTGYNRIEQCKIE